MVYGAATASSLFAGYLAWRSFRPHRRYGRYHHERER